MGVKVFSFVPFYQTTNIVTTTTITLHLIKKDNLKGNLDNNLHRFTYYMWCVLQYWTKILITKDKKTVKSSVIFNFFFYCFSSFFHRQNVYSTINTTISPFPLFILVHSWSTASSAPLPHTFFFQNFASVNLQ